MVVQPFGAVGIHLPGAHLLHRHLIGQEFLHLVADVHQLLIVGMKAVNLFSIGKNLLGKFLWDALGQLLLQTANLIFDGLQVQHILRNQEFQQQKQKMPQTETAAHTLSQPLHQRRKPMFFSNQQQLILLKRKSKRQFLAGSFLLVWHPNRSLYALCKQFHLAVVHRPHAPFQHLMMRAVV